MSARLKADPEHLRKVSALLGVALSMDATDRGAWLQTLPPEQQSFVPLLTTLLARASVETGRFMHSPIGLALEGLRDFETEDDQPGDTIGPYRLIRELGSGGMATVWLAERSDGVLNRQVALKLPREGWTAGLAERMVRERDILGALEHAHIARLYDAGVTIDGRPWMAMECIDGAPIDSYCREHALDLRQRLRLFVQVTEAVAHAHARLIAHRDLKPSNILVTPEGEVRLLDFGVAKLLATDLPVDTGITQRMGRAMTPDYASPEQIAAKPVTVATDLYSLGVVLYELVTGQRPYRLGRQSAAALEEAILAADVPLASTRVQGDRALASQLRGDIDTILVKALRKDPSQRYASAESFAADLTRHLEGEPVLARPPTRRYRAAKFAGRHRLAIGATGAVVVSVVIGLGAVLWQAQAAQAEAARAEQVKDFIASILKQATPQEGVTGIVTTSVLLTNIAQRIERELASNPRVAAELGVIVGQGFFSLGEPRKGETTLRAAVTRAEREFGRGHPITLQGKALLVESLGYQDIALTERLLGEVVPDALAGLPATAEPAVFALRSQSYVFARQGRRAESLAAAEQALDLAERHLGQQHKDTIRVLLVMSSVHAILGEPAEQLASATDALNRARAGFGHPLLATAGRRYGEALIENERPAEAVTALTAVVQRQRTLDVVDTPRVLLAVRQLAIAQASAGQLGDALASMREAIAMQARLAPDDVDERRAYRDALAELLLTARLANDAVALDGGLGATATDAVDPSQKPTIARDVARATTLALRGDAEAAARVAGAAADRAGDANRRARARAWLAAALNSRLQGKPAEALALAQRALADPQPKALGLALQADAAAEAGSAWLDLGDFSHGEEALKASRVLFEQNQVEPSVRMSGTLVGLARVHLHAGRGDQAEALLRPLVDAWANLNPGSAWHGEALHWLARAEALQGKAQAASADGDAAALMLRQSALPAMQQLAARRSFFTARSMAASKRTPAAASS